MNIHELTPIETKRTDPMTGAEHTFTANPPIDLNTWDLKPGIAAKDFIVLLLWQIKAGIWDTGSFENLIEQTTEVLPLINQVVGEVGFYVEDAAQMLERVKPGEKTRVKPGDKFGYHYYVKPVVNSEPIDELTPSDEMLRVLCKEVLHSLPLEVAVSWFIDLNKAELDRRSEEINNTAVLWFDEVNNVDSKQERGTSSNVGNDIPLSDTDAAGEKSSAADKKQDLFPNSKHIGSNQFGMHMFLADNYVRGIREVGKDSVAKQFDKNNPDPHPRVKTNASFTIKNKGKVATETEFVFDQEKFAIRTAEEFRNRLLDLRDAKVLQTFGAIMKLANIQNSATFSKIPLSELMQIILKPSGDNKFNKDQRKDFSLVLHKLADISLNVYAIGQDVNLKTGKKGKVLLREERGVKVFRMVAEYSVRKEHQGKPRESLGTDDFDQDVIERFSGEILPGHNHMFQQPARIFQDSFLKMNANTDAKAIILCFVFETRFSQMPDKPLEVNRPYLIDICDYQKTNNTKPSQATKQLANNLDKLKRHGIIAGYSGLTNNDQAVIKIYPPTPSKVNTLA